METRLGRGIGWERLWCLPSCTTESLLGLALIITVLKPDRTILSTPTPWNLEPDDNESTSQNVSSTEVLFNVESPNEVLDEKQICKFELEYLNSRRQNIPLRIHTLDFQTHVH